MLLRVFGANIGRGVNVKPGLVVKFPWRLRVGEHSWIGERVWIDNLAQVEIGNHVCVSQGAYFCTGSHDWSLQRFDLITKPITVLDQSWISAGTILGPGVVVGEGAVLALGSTTYGDLDAWCIYSGNPAVIVKRRNRPESNT